MSDSVEDRACTAGETDVESLVRRLASIDVCAVSDALDALGLPGVVEGLLPLWQGARLVGRAVTMQLVEGAVPAGTSAPHLGARAIEACVPGDVIVVDNAGRVGMGAWGGMLTLAASLRGVRGVIIDGACRDVDEARDLGFPVFARQGVARTARGRVREESTGQPVTIAGVRVSTGDVVVADGSGAVVLNANCAVDVVRRAETISAREMLMKVDLRGGRGVAEVLGKSYETMLQTLE